MKSRIIGAADGAAELEGYPESARGLDLLRMRSNEADADGCYSLFFDVVSQDANGGRATRSDGQEEDGVDIIITEQPGDFPCRRFKFLRCKKAGDGIMETCQAADGAFLL